MVPITSSGQMYHTIIMIMLIIYFASCGVCCTDMKPTMLQLNMLKTSKGDKVEIIETLAQDWKRVGFLMDFDPVGRKVACIEAENAHKRNGLVTCCQEIFMLWLEKPDATWANLIQLLYDSEQKDLAEQVKDALGL